MDYSLIKSYTKEATLALIDEKLNNMDILMLIGDKIQRNELLKLLNKYYDKNEIKTILLNACQVLEQDEKRCMKNKLNNINIKKIKDKNKVIEETEEEKKIKQLKKREIREEIVKKYLEKKEIKLNNIKKMLIEEKRLGQKGEYFRRLLNGEEEDPNNDDDETEEEEEEEEEEDEEEKEEDKEYDYEYDYYHKEDPENKKGFCKYCNWSSCYAVSHINHQFEKFKCKYICKTFKPEFIMYMYLNEIANDDEEIDKYYEENKHKMFEEEEEKKEREKEEKDAEEKKVFLEKINKKTNYNHDIILKCSNHDTCDGCGRSELSCRCGDFHDADDY